jgi:hypothetical protein
MGCEGMSCVSDEGKSVVDEGWQGFHVEKWVDFKRVSVGFLQQVKHSRFEITVYFKQLLLRSTLVVVV